MKRYYIRRILTSATAFKIVVVWEPPFYSGRTVLVRVFEDARRAQFSRPYTVTSYADNPERGWMPLERTQFHNIQQDTDSWIPFSLWWLDSARRVAGDTPSGSSGQDILRNGYLVQAVCLSPEEIDNLRLGIVRSPTKTNHKIGVPKGVLP